MIGIRNGALVVSLLAGGFLGRRPTGKSGGPRTRFAC